jgi:hypothetical protein
VVSQSGTYVTSSVLSNSPRIVGTVVVFGAIQLNRRVRES